MKWMGIIASIWIGLAAGAQQTNVLFVIADDLGIDSLSGFNSNTNASYAPTPTINSLQAAGISFTRFYAYSTCSPTRGSMMTGRYGFRTGITSPLEGDHDLLANEFTLPEALLSSGVISNHLAQVGKWHLGSAADAPNTLGGWPHFSGALGGGVGDYYSWQKTVDGITTNGYSVYATTDTVNDAVEWIGQQGTHSWFLWVAFNAPHTPHHRPPNELHDYDQISPNGSNGSRRHFNAMTQAMDTELGRLLASVDLAETTVIFMGDNGTLGGVIQPPFIADHSKGSIYEGGVRVPLVVAGAAVSNSLAGTTNAGVIHSVDMYATILDLFGVAAADVVPEELVLDARSFVPTLRGEAYARSPAEVVTFNSLDIEERAITAGDYKFIDLGTGTQEFYNVALDIAEMNNLLAGVLSPAEQAAFDSLANKLAIYTNIPVMYAPRIETNGAFAVDVGWFANEGITLYRASNLSSNDWASVAGQTVEDDGGSTLVLRDPSPPSDKAFYRASH